jgi:hypothetical protein
MTLESSLNPEAVKSAVKELILANEAELVSNLTIQGMPITLRQVTKSNLTLTNTTVFVVVHIGRAYGVSNNATNVSRPTRKGVYNVQVELLETGQPEVSDDQPYETVHETFIRFASRVVGLFESQTFIGTDPKTSLQKSEGENADRRVDLFDLCSPEKDRNDIVHASLHARIAFTLEGRCYDGTAIYS